MSREAWEGEIADRTYLKRLPRLAEVANAASSWHPNRALAITAAVINLTCGELQD